MSSQALHGSTVCSFKFGSVVVGGRAGRKAAGNLILVEMRRFSRCISCTLANNRSGVLRLTNTGNGYYCGVPSQRWDLRRPGLGFLEERSVYGGIGFVRREHSLSRDWFKRLWAADKKDDRIKEVEKKKKDFGRSNWSPFSRGRTEDQGGDGRVSNDGFRYSAANATVVEQKPVRQYEPPTSIEETKLEPLLARSDLLITRDIEWANLMFAIEQESRFKIVDPYHPHSSVGSIVEQSNIIYRQLLRTRRPFIAHITDAYGVEIFTIRRPFWWINSTIYAEVDRKEIGVVHRRWHLWKRIYDLYLGKQQFAVVENPGFWNWTFTLKDSEEKALAEINRDWRGIGFELFTDAGQYVIRFGASNSSSMLSEHANIPELNTVRSLSLSERAIAVSLAVSLDCDYFSRHGGGWGMPFFIAGE